MKRLVALLSLGCVSLYGNVDDAWLKKAEQNYDATVTEWLRQGLEAEKMKRRSGSTKDQRLPKGRCLVGAKEAAIVAPRLHVFMSFSVADETWLALSKDLARHDGVFVLRGLPENSFRVLAKRLVQLRDRGVTAQIEIDPRRFQQYQVTSVPTFVIGDEDKYDKVAGNVSLRYAVELMSQQGEVEDAKVLFKRLKDES